MNTQNYAGQISGATPVEPSALKTPLINLVVRPGESATQLWIALNTRKNELINELVDATKLQSAEEVITVREELAGVNEMIQELFLQINFTCEEVVNNPHFKQRKARSYHAAVEKLMKETGWNS